MKVLLTAFDAFGKDSINASREALERLCGTPGMILEKRVLPTIFGEAVRVLCRAVRETNPDAVICLGQAAGRGALTPERVAVNLRDAAVPDNAGQMPVDEPAIPGAPAAYFSTLPIKAMAAAARERGVPAEISNTAGCFVCNDLMFGLLHAVHTEFPGLRAGFVHVPLLPEQASDPVRPSMPLDLIVIGLEAMLGTLI